MTLQVHYCNHETANLDIRERLAFGSPEVLSSAFKELQHRFPQTEAVILSTCNRVELYTAHSEPDSAPTSEELVRFIAENRSVPLDDVMGHVRSAHAADAVRHLFQVTSSLDSMVLGEPQIVKQVKDAYAAAEEHEACGPLTHLLFQSAIRVSSRVRTETRLSEGRVSIASVAVGDFGKGIFDRFDDKLVLVIGAGDMAEETLRYLADEGATRIVVINRSRERATTLAEAWGGSVQPWDALDHWLGMADVIVSTTGATEPVVDRQRFEAARAAGERQPVFILDLGLPRDFAPGSERADDNVYLFDIESLEETCQANRSAREQEIVVAQSIVEEETHKFLADLNHRATGPIVKQLRENWEEIKQDELKRLFDRLSHLPADDKSAVEETINRIVNKLLHPPLQAIKTESRKGDESGLLDALRQLFHLGD